MVGDTTEGEDTEDDTDDGDHSKPTMEKTATKESTAKTAAKTVKQGQPDTKTYTGQAILAGERS